MVNTEIAPLEASLKALLVDIVRRCQSTVAQNFGRIKSAPSNAGTALNVVPSTSAMMISREDGHSQRPPPTSQEETAASASGIDGVESFYQEPPLLDATEAAPLPGSFGDNIASIPYNSSNSDSGYRSLPRYCDCPFDSFNFVSQRLDVQFPWDVLDDGIHSNGNACHVCGLDRPLFRDHVVETS